MVEDGVKAIVIACNTATSAAAKELRRAFKLPIIGVEPALKPAATASGRHRVLVMATPVTLSLQKYRDLWDRYAGYAECVSAPVRDWPSASSAAGWTHRISPP